MSLFSKSFDVAASAGNAALQHGIALGGILGVAKDHWALTTAAVTAAVAIGGYSSPARQGMPVGPTTQGRNPASTSNYDLGATGGLVFDLHKLR